MGMNSTNVITTPEEAVDQFIGEQFTEWAMGYLAKHMAEDQSLAKISSNQWKPEKIRKFMIQEFMAAEAFLGSKESDPGFLRFAIANLSESDDPTAESALEILEKRRQEELSGHFPDRELWIRLLKALGASEEEITNATPKEPTRTYIAELSDIYSNSEWQTAAGAFASHERALSHEYEAIIKMLRANTSLSDKDMEVLIIHTDQQSQRFMAASHIIDKIVFDPENKQMVWDGIKRQMDIRQEFLADLVKYLETN